MSEEHVKENTGEGDGNVEVNREEGLR